MTSTPRKDSSNEPPQQSAAQTWHVRPFRAGDEPGLLELFGLVFGRPRSVEHLRWKLLARNTGPTEMVWVVAESESERILGHYAGIPLEVKIGDRVTPGIHSVEAMAHPGWRKQGMLTSLGAIAHQEWARHGYELVIGLPNDKWGTRNAALGYVPHFPLTWLKFPLRLDRVLNRRFTARAGRIAGAPARAASQLWRHFHVSRHKPLEAVHVVRVSLLETIAEIELIWTALSPLYPNTVVRSPDYLRWRYGEEPTGDFIFLMSEIDSRPTGFVTYRIVMSKSRVTGYVADLFVAPNDLCSARALLMLALDDLDRLGAGSVLAAVPPGSPAYSHLFGNGFRPTKSGFTFEIVPLSQTIDPAMLRDPSQWHLTAGDFDIV